jgi:hypothetical protein
MTLHEPATFATDCAIALWSTWLGARLKVSDRATSWWRRTFYGTAVAALAGGIYHGFGPAMPNNAADLLWRATLLALVATSFGLTLAAAYRLLPETSFRFWRRAATVKAALFAGYVIARPFFLSAIMDYGTSMLFVLVAALHAWFAKGAREARWLVAGVIASALGAAVQQLGWAPHPRFNHNDLYHLIQMVALGLFYRGARMLAEASR